MPGATQKNRKTAVNTPLGEDVLLFKSMHVSEHIGSLFTISLDLLSTDGNIDFEKIIGKNVSVRDEIMGGTRYYNGYVSTFSQTGFDGEFFHYSAVLRPWLWFLTRTSDCRIFQNKSVPEIIMEIFKEAGFTDVKDNLSIQYRKWEYCVQYRETDFNFVSRLMEQEGIYYYFKHEDGKHDLWLMEMNDAHLAPGDKYDTVPYYPPTNDATRERDHIYDWTITREVQPGAYALNEFDFKKPKSDLKNTTKAIFKRSTDFEIYDYPGEYVESKDGMEYTKVRMQELDTMYQVIDGQGSARGLRAGYAFTLEKYPRLDQNKEYLILYTSIHIVGNDYSSQGGGGAEFSCDFKVLDKKTQYRHPRVTPKPIVQGPQTAIVVGPSGEEIHTDEHGRVKVMFHWDRYSKADESSSCWIRVSQVWAGKSWGAMYIPRIGQEVIVDFLEGDPDQPIITGRVYNGEAKPPYTLPDEKTKSTIKSNSSKGGGGFNEFRFEDKKGEEQIFMHGQKNMDVRILNDTKKDIGHDYHFTIHNDQFEHVDRNKEQWVEGDYKGVTVGETHETFKSDRKVLVETNDNITIDADQKMYIQGDSNLKVDGNINHESGKSFSLKAAMEIIEQAGTDVTLKGGVNVVVEAGLKLTLKVGGSFVVIGPAGVDISGPMVNINSGGSAGSGGSPTSPASADEPDEIKDPPKVADNAKAGKISTAKRTPAKHSKVKKGSVKVGKYTNPQAQSLSNAAKTGAPFCEKCEAAKKKKKEQDKGKSK